MHACKDVEIHSGTETEDLPFCNWLRSQMGKCNKILLPWPTFWLSYNERSTDAARGSWGASSSHKSPLAWTSSLIPTFLLAHENEKKQLERGRQRGGERGKGLGFCWTVVVPPEQQSSASHRVCQLDSVALTPRAAKLYPPLSSPSQLTHNITFSYSCVCVCVFLCLSYNKPFSFFLLVSWLPCFQPLCFLISTSHSSLTTHFPISANSPFLQIFLPPSLSSPLSSPLLSSPLPQQEILPETLYFKNPSNNTISTTPNKKQNKTKTKTKTKTKNKTKTNPLLKP